MKPALVLLATVLLAACRSNTEAAHPTEQSAAATPSPTLDFSAWHGKSMTAEEFVKVCQQVSDFNFTYTDATRAGLSARTVRLADADRVAVDRFESFLDAQLATCGFESEHVGPEHLHVLLIQPRGS